MSLLVQACRYNGGSIFTGVKMFLNGPVNVRFEKWPAVYCLSERSPGHSADTAAVTAEAHPLEIVVLFIMEPFNHISKTVI